MWFWWLVLFLNFHNLNDLAKWSYKDPNKVSYYLQQHLYYDKKHMQDCLWINPEEAFKNRKGVCREFASIFKTVLDNWKVDWSQQILCVFAPGYGHAVCVFYYKQQWCYFDIGSFKLTKNIYSLDLKWTNKKFNLGGIIYTGDGNIYRVADYIVSDWTSISFVDINGTPINKEDIKLFPKLTVKDNPEWNKELMDEVFFNVKRALVN